ncbi:hypothetical protein LTR62_000517 [Meristemomyces frigidus]|uniref:PCI domain-containing protein n=1 Tax=Meristemomyces frigidus TaxID=1508187 RepID=A0AAN7T9E6_9PEZI|nr:hypothetical protein LTR62_000517 [Meristemomyces frigidus]
MASNGIGSPPKKVKHEGSPTAGSSDLAPPTFDLDIWASHYEGALLPLRLSHIAIHCPALAEQAMTMAISTAHQGKDVRLYTRLCELAAQMHFPDLSSPDSTHVAKQEEANRRELSRLEQELRGYKNNLIRESIRMGQEDLATHQLATGGPLPDPTNPMSASNSGYNAAYQAYGKMRDYCTTPTHVASMTLRLIYTAIVQAVLTQQLGSPASQNWNSVLSNSSRLRTAGVKEEEQVKLTPIACAMAGISQLSQGNYRDAAQVFLATPKEYITIGPVQNFDVARSVASANDVAIYGGLCALATLSRPELIDLVLGGNFRAFLELEPHMRKIISLYTTAKYQSCLELLQRYYSDWSLDIFLGAQAVSAPTGSSHVDALFARIREKSITAYFSSFSQVSLSALATTFPPISSSPAAMEDEVLRMIRANQLDARLDVVNGLLVAPYELVGDKTQREAKQVAEEVERTLLLRLHRVNVSLAGLGIPKAKGNSNGAWAMSEGIENGAY